MHPPVPAAPWRSLFLSQLSKLDSPELVLSTVHREPSSTSSSSHSYFPRARYCIFRGMWTELPPNKHNSAPRNPSGVFASDLPTITTDARMEKVAELFASSSPELSGGAGDEEHEHEHDVFASGGGGPVEAVWWIQPTMTQWRMRGRAWLVGPDIDSDSAAPVKRAISSRMRHLPDGPDSGSGSGSTSDWSWTRELTAHFGNVSPGMRGSWRNPQPGKPVVEEPEPPEEHRLGQKIEDLEDPIARGNFRVLVIVPNLVERLDLEDPAKAKRHRYTYVEADEGKGGPAKWTEEELWP